MKYAFLILIVAMASICLADGGMIPRHPYPIEEPSQVAVISWDGTTETLLLSTAAKPQSLSEFAWIIPVTSNTTPEVSEGNADVITAIQEFFGAQRHNVQSMDISYGAAATSSGITLIESKKIGIYDTMIVQADNAGRLVTWLQTEGYEVPTDVVPILRDYLGDNHYFIINRVDLSNEFASEINAIRQDVPEFFGLYVGEQYQLVLNKELTDFTPGRDYGALAEIYENAMRGGISTPLLIKFTPPEPTYPMHISSMNDGYSQVKVYLVSNDPVASDTNNILYKSRGPLSITGELRDQIGDDFPLDGQLITEFSWSGSLSALEEDSMFRINPGAGSDLWIYVGVFAAVVTLLAVVVYMRR